MPRAYAYASAPDVIQHLTLATAFSATSRPNSTQVHGQILDIADQLDAVLAAADYTVPVATGATSAFDLLNSYNAIGAAMMVTAGHPAGKDSKHLEFLERRWNAILKGISDGSIALDAAQDTSVALPRFGGSRSASVAGASPYFAREFPDGI